MKKDLTDKEKEERMNYLTIHKCKNEDERKELKELCDWYFKDTPTLTMSFSLTEEDLRVTMERDVELSAVAGAVRNLNVIEEGVVPAVEGCVGYTNEEFERVDKENNDPESAKIESFNKTVEEANNIRSRVLKYVNKIKRERAYNIDLCMTFERYVEIADKDAERAMAFLKEACPFNEETEVFIRKRYNMSIAVDPEEN